MCSGDEVGESLAQRSRSRGGSEEFGTGWAQVRRLAGVGSGLGGQPPLRSWALFTAGKERCYRCVVPRFALLFGGRGGCLKNRRDPHPIHRRYRRWRVLMYGRVVPTMPTRELYVQENQGHSPMGGLVRRLTATGIEPARVRLGALPLRQRPPQPVKPPPPPRELNVVCAH